jgi:hypothetical protein
MMAGWLARSLNSYLSSCRRFVGDEHTENKKAHETKEASYEIESAREMFIKV